MFYTRKSIIELLHDIQKMDITEYKLRVAASCLLRATSLAFSIHEASRPIIGGLCI